MKLCMFIITLAFAVACFSAEEAQSKNYRDRLQEDEVIYFLLPDRFENGDATNDKGGLEGDRLKTGFDPSHKGFYHGGDLKGLTGRLDYIQSLGATAIWLAPIFKNKPVQGAPGQETAGYHGYWVTDFTTVDPHLGTEKDFKTFVDAAHARGMKVYMDIITNHTADVIAYKECPVTSCIYRSRANFPYSREVNSGAAINSGFLGDNIQTSENFARLTNPNFAYTPFVSNEQKNIKKPDWLNDVTLYHNRGDSTFRNESSLMGDFVGLDDIMTENPSVIQGFIDVYTAWIDKYGIDGFRIDTAKHVNEEFWPIFSAAIQAHAKAKGIPNFHIFGEVASGDIDIVTQAYYTRNAKLPSVLDFTFRRGAIDVSSGIAGTDKWADIFLGDALYEGGAPAALRMPTFLGNHDFGRFAGELRRILPKANDDEVLQRVKLGHLMLMTLRGVPVIYSGDEQGFSGDGGDQDAREDMFASKVISYNDNKLLGTSRTNATSSFEQGHPIYNFIKMLSFLRKGNPALRYGKQILRNYDAKPGLFAFSRVDNASGQDVLVILNTSAARIVANVEIDATTVDFTDLYGKCPASIGISGSVSVSIPPLDAIICIANKKL
jgi:glycosidase